MASKMLIVYGVILICANFCASTPRSDCNVIHYNFYGNDAQDRNQCGESRDPPAVGPPGKSGPRGMPGLDGERGDKGEVGQKGERGENLEESVGFRELTKRVQELEQFKRNILEPPKSCSHIIGAESDSGMYLINPNSNYWRPFQVFCNFSADSATTLVGHDSEAEGQVTCEGQQCHRRDVTYNAADAQIRALIGISSSCRQFIKYRCKGSVLMNSESTPYGAWISATGSKKFNWDGNVPDFYCACGLSGTCIHSTVLTPPRCNCDNNQDVWTSDEGYLTSKDDLPVKALMFGDAGDSNEEGWYTLGKLECSGRA